MVSGPTRHHNSVGLTRSINRSVTVAATPRCAPHCLTLLDCAAVSRFLASSGSRKPCLSAWLVAATTINERVGVAYWSACTHYEKARSLDSRDAPGDLELAEALLQHARTIATEEGFAPIERRARQTLAKL